MTRTTSWPLDASLLPTSWMVLSAPPALGLSGVAVGETVEKVKRPG
ncbi:MAG: hypothetical protein RXS42_07195 [Nitrososphaeria archaeon]